MRSLSVVGKRRLAGESVSVESGEARGQAMIHVIHVIHVIFRIR